MRFRGFLTLGASLLAASVATSIRAESTNELNASQRLQLDNERMRVERQREFDAAQTKAIERDVKRAPNTIPNYFPIFVTRSYGPPFYHTYNSKAFYNTNLLLPGLGKHLMEMENFLPGICTNFTPAQLALTNNPTIHERTNWAALTNWVTVWTDGVCSVQCGVLDQIPKERSQLSDAELAQRLVGFWGGYLTTNVDGFSYIYNLEFRAGGLVRWQYRVFNPAQDHADADEVGVWRVQDHSLFTRVTNSTMQKVSNQPEARWALPSVEAANFTSRADDGRDFNHFRKHGESFITQTNIPAAR